MQDHPLRLVRSDAAVGERSAAIERVYRDHSHRLWRALLGYCGDPEIASEALSEAFAQLLARRHADELRSPSDWVWTSAFRIATGLLKRRPDPPVVARADAELPEPVTDLVRALVQLPDRQRVAIVMHDYADRPVDEIAQVLHVSAATVYVHLSRARRRLRQLLEDRDGS